jgi:hypothetical protein
MRDTRVGIELVSFFTILLELRMFRVLQKEEAWKVNVHICVTKRRLEQVDFTVYGYGFFVIFSRLIYAEQE